MRLIGYPAAATPPELRRQIAELQDDAWPPTLHGHDHGHDPALLPLSLLLVDGTTVLSALDILRKEIVHAGRSYRAGGLSSVVTRRSARGRGHGLRLVSGARERMAGLGLDLGLFTCDRPLRRFYERAGWRSLTGTVLVGGTSQEPFPSDQPGFDKVTMAGFFTDDARRHRVSFERARIALHPGEIDRLW